MTNETGAWRGHHDAAALAERVRKILAGRRGISEKKMFGGTCAPRRDPGRDEGQGTGRIRLGRPRRVRRAGAEELDRIGRKLRFGIAAEEEEAMNFPARRTQ